MPPGLLSKDIAGTIPGSAANTKDTITRRQTFHSGAKIEQQKSNNFTAKHHED